MGQEGDDRLSLPVPPPPNPAARRTAIDAAMRRFDGLDDAPGPRRRFSLAGWASTHRAAAGGLVTAALVAVVAIPAIQVAIRDRPAEISSDVGLPEVRNEPPAESIAADQAAPAPAQAPAIPGQPAAEPPPAEPAAVAAQVGGIAASGREEKAKVAAPESMMAAPALIAPPPPAPPPPPRAQAEAQSEAATADDNIVVTGSRIRRQNMDSASPVTVIDAEAQFLSRLQDAIRNDERAAVAGMVALPLRVRIDGEQRTYRSAREIDLDYDRIFTPAVRSAAAALRPNTMRTRDRGRLRGNSRIWFGCGQTDCPSASSIRIREIIP